MTEKQEGTEIERVYEELSQYVSRYKESAIQDYQRSIEGKTTYEAFEILARGYSQADNPTCGLRTEAALKVMNNVVMEQDSDSSQVCVTKQWIRKQLEYVIEARNSVTQLMIADQLNNPDIYGVGSIDETSFTTFLPGTSFSLKKRLSSQPYRLYFKDTLINQREQLARIFRTQNNFNIVGLSLTKKRIFENKSEQRLIQTGYPTQSSQEEREGLIKNPQIMMLKINHTISQLDKNLSTEEYDTLIENLMRYITSVESIIQGQLYHVGIRLLKKAQEGKLSQEVLKELESTIKL